MTSEPRSLADRTVIITGGGSGVGLACATLFIEAGASVLIVGRKEVKLVDSCKILGHRSHYLADDVTVSATANAAMQIASRHFGTPASVLVNNAGTIVRKTAQDTTDAEWARVFDVNVNGLFYFSRAFANQCPHDSAIVNVSSTCGRVGAAGLAAYCASKGAVDQLTRTMALELAGRAVTVNAVAPGAIDSPMLFSQHDDPRAVESVVDRNAATIPLGRVADPVEVARSVLFLAQQRHITGTILGIDGGYTAQ